MPSRHISLFERSRDTSVKLFTCKVRYHSSHINTSGLNKAFIALTGIKPYHELGEIQNKGRGHIDSRLTYKDIGMQVQPTKTFKYTLLLTSFVVPLSLANITPAQAASVDRFRSNDDTFHRIQDVLDTLFPDDELVPGLSGTLGGGVGLSPDYMGSSNYGLTFVPFVRLNYKNIISLSGTSLRWNTFQGERWRVGLFGRYMSGRGSEQSGTLGGLNNVKSTIALGPFVEYRFASNAKVLAEWRHAISGARGDEIRVSANMGLYQSEDKRYGLQGAATTIIGTSKNLRKNFGITPEEAARSTVGLAAYEPGGGLYSVSLSIGGRYQMTERWGLGHFTEIERLLGDADDSPLVKAGSPWQLSSGVGVFYNF